MSESEISNGSPMMMRVNGQLVPMAQVVDHMLLEGNKDFTLKSDIGELGLSDTAEAMSSAKKNATRGSYERSKTKSWSKKKLGAPNQVSEKTEYSAMSSDLRRDFRRSPNTGGHGVTGFKPKVKGTKVTTASTVGAPNNKKCGCKACYESRKAAAIWFQGGKVGAHPTKIECTV